LRPVNWASRLPGGEKPQGKFVGTEEKKGGVYGDEDPKIMKAVRKDGPPILEGSMVGGLIGLHLCSRKVATLSNS